MQNTLHYVQEIEKNFGYVGESAKCIASFIYEKYFPDVKLEANPQMHDMCTDRELDCIYTIYLIFMLCYNLENKDVCLSLDDFFKEGSVLDAYKTYQKECMRIYDLEHPAESKNFYAIDFDKELFNIYTGRAIYGEVVCIEGDKGTQDKDSERPLVFSMNRLYIRRNYLYESYIAAYIANKEKNSNIDEAMIEGILPRLFDTDKKDINHQLLCALLSIYQGFSIISGGPGTGKTTTVLKLLFLHLYLNQQRNLDIRLCAPTGKAAGRMKESIISGLENLKNIFKEDTELLSLIDKIPTEACTIHSLIGVIPRSSRSKYNENNKLSIDILIVDEVSMVDMALFVKLLRAIEDKTIVIMLGDKDQLCSVEAGSVLGDICQAFFSNKILKDDTLAFISKLSGYDASYIKEHGAISERVGLLKKSHRFKEGSSIFNLAMQVNASLNENLDAQGKLDLLQGTMQSIKDNRHDAISLYEIDDDPKNTDIKEIIVDITQKALASSDKKGAESFDGRASYDPYLKLLCDHNFRIDNAGRGGLCVADVFKAMNRFRILCSNREGDLGCNRLSYEIESAVKRKYGFSDTEFFPGRIILVTRNNKILNLNNGDVGFVAYDSENIGTDRENNLYVWFLNTQNGKESAARIPIAFLDSYESAFSMTIHKSQGSEYEHVLIALSSRYNEVLTKELIYTAITRAKEYVSMIYTKNIFYKACLEEVRRQSGLKDRLISKLSSDSDKK